MTKNNYFIRALNRLGVVVGSAFLLVCGSVQAQVASYTFSQSTVAYTPITGGTSHWGITSTTRSDDQTAAAVAIGFTFGYGGSNFSTVGISNNGNIIFGTPASEYEGLNGASNNIITALGDDLSAGYRVNCARTSGSPTLTTVTNTTAVDVGDNIYGAGIPAGTTVLSKTVNTITMSANATSTSAAATAVFSGGGVRSELLGTSPNRIFVIQWTDASEFGENNTSLDFQIRLYETSNNIEIVYGECYYATASLADDATVGLRGASAADFNNRQSTGNFNATTAGTLITNVVAYSAIAHTPPANGLSLLWTAPCFGPATTPTPAITSVALSWTSVIGATNYNVEYRLAGAGLWTPDPSNPYFATTGSIAGLTAATNYEVRATANDGSCLANGATATFSTNQNPVVSYPFVEGGETGLSGWSILNGAQPNKWAVGTAINNGGSNGIYISQDNGVTNTYNIASASVVHIYREFTMPAALEINLSYQWTGLGESCCDYLRVWLVPTSFVPTPGTQITATGVAPTGRVQLGGNINNSASWNTNNVVIPAVYAGTSFRLVFEWRNDGSIGPNPPIALDNINVNFSNCASPTGVALAVTSTTTADLSWSSLGNYFIEWGPNGYTPGTAGSAGGSATGSATVSSSPYSITGLVDLYDVYIRQDCGGSGYSSNVFRDFDFLQGDECFSAETVTCSLTPVTGSTTGYTLGVDPTGGTGCGAGGYSAPTRWYKLAGTNELVTVDLSASSYDTRVTIMSGTCGALTCVAGDDDSGTGLTSLVSFNAFTGTDYYIIIHGFGTASGNYSMTVTCAFLCLPITNNDECASSAALTLGTTANSNNQCATASAQGPISAGCGGSFASYYDVWFGFTTNANTVYTVAINATGVAAPAAAGNHYYTLMTACGAGVACTPFNMGTGVSSEVTLLASTPYILRVYTSSQDAGLYTLGNFKVTVTAVSCPAPTVLSAAATSNSANLSWTNNSAATAFQIEFGATPYTFTGTPNYSGSYPVPFNVTGLSSGVQYTYRVRNNCGVGDDSNWSTAFVFATPAVNDDICTAITLSVGNTCTPLLTSNFGATLSTGVAAATCGTPNTDVWYKFVAPASGEVKINVQQVTGGLTDAVMQLYSGVGTCPTIPTLTALICNDDGGPGLLPLIDTTDPLTDITLVGGATYYIRLWGFASTTGQFTMCLVNGAAPAPANDEPATAVNVPVSGNGYPSCGALLGDITTATNSAQSTTFTGADVWYKFTAQSTGCRIVLSSGSMNCAITLLDNTFTEIQTENASAATGGTEILNYGLLTVGQVYYVGVGQDAGAGGGPFSLCVQTLGASTCADGPGSYDLCTNFKPTYTGANSYVMSFTQTSPSAGPTTVASTPSQLALSSASLNLRHTYGYSVQINAVYNLVNGVGAADPITVNGTAPCAITIAAHADLDTKPTQVCPATVFKGTTLQAKPFICAAVNHTIQFTEVGDCAGTSIGGIAFTTTTSGSSPSKKLSQVAGVQAGKWYEVIWTPNFSYGPGAPGNATIIQVAASSGAEDVVSEFENVLDSEEVAVSANIYPNPNNGDMVNINITDITSDNVFVRIFDNMGRVVYVNRFTVDGSLNTNVTFTRPLANGLYMVEFTVDGETFTERMIVEK
ncbi:MAG: T9SS type A sorting domain-containing protein [Flavobacteriales bacterium]